MTYHKPCKSDLLRLETTLFKSVVRMKKLSEFSTRLCGTVLASALLLSGCAGDMAVEVENTKAAQEMARLSRPPGSVFAGWRVFQDRCASCHGPDAMGAAGPNLLPLVQQMGPRRFLGLVLKRYDWNLPPAQAGQKQQAMDTRIEDVLQRREQAITMPAWQDTPSVNAHIADLYAYLAARAEGSQGPGQPPP
ncbi:MAG: hypothetical protein RIR45_1408 [Pseudomonadota bacterium]